MARLVHREKLSMVIFPEGTRSLQGRVKTFAWKGLATLLKYCPDALIVPIAINNNWQLQRNKGFDISTGNHLTWKVLQLVAPTGRTAEAPVAELRELKAGETTR